MSYPSNDRQKDDPLLIFVFAALLVITVYFFVNKSITFQQFKLDLLIKEARFFSYVSPVYRGDFKKECYNLVYLSQKVKDLQSEGVSISVPKLKRYITQFSSRTRFAARLLTFLICLTVCCFMIRSYFREQKAVKNKGLNLIDGKSGVEGFLEMVGSYLPQQVVEDLRRSPTPSKLADAFALARQKVNIPNNQVARLFPKLSPERLAVLQVGKSKEFDVQSLMGISDTRAKPVGIFDTRTKSVS